MEHVVDMRLSFLLFQHAFCHCRCVFEFVNVIHDQQCVDASIQDSLVTWRPLVHVFVSDVFQFECVSLEVHIRTAFWFVVVCVLFDYKPEVTQCDG